MKIVELPYFQDAGQVNQPELRNGLMAPKINGAMEIAQGTIFAQQIVVGARAWVHNIVWTATDYNTMSWGTGTIQFAGGDSYAIDAGNTGNITGTVYIYLDLEVSTTVLQQSSTYSDAVGDKKILLAIVTAASDTAAKCLITPMGAEGTTISGNKITTGKIQSTDTRTYFDLDAKRIIVNDGSTDRILIGYQSGGF